ncbi:hypothetical protein, partial [Sulfitobacter indolifex]|uniref:hypothetical protein n=1 Tax=Sulfitobacter indolifex TaxID=225422 RepID=UPI001981BAA1
SLVAQSFYHASLGLLKSNLLTQDTNFLVKNQVDVAVYYCSLLRTSRNKAIISPTAFELGRSNSVIA